MLASVLLVLPAVAAAKPSTERMLDRINHFRAHYGLRALHLSHSLEHSAHAYSEHLLRAGAFGHSARIHASRRFHSLGEILELHMGKRAAVGLTLRDWLHSPGHRAVIMSSGFRFAGAGYASGRWHGRKVTIWTMHFGRR